MARTRRRSAPLLALALIALAPAAVHSGDSANVVVQCMGAGDDCRQRIIRIPDGMPGQVLKFEYCREGDCDRAHREHWITHYLVPPPGEVCHNTDINEALKWLEQNRKGWLLAGWGCVSREQLPV
ncbi:MAG: hypothetical protein K8F92_07765 [Hyphomicrobium sp.]|uniref:hypothetical protein n=1 Tax=Hyphomicrobium sp. TaxID=82 RepID=UPI00132B6BA0|nr:hypothetical protein [Hyphomicrobium sp.]KAB2939238.1 MAG: hypothetical protein F9K20_17825 [Hyphomicrobium sp.]MBZ0209535.1 hypothetical protein [Hyphomicrobium sp.]